MSDLPRIRRIWRWVSWGLTLFSLGAAVYAGFQRTVQRKRAELARRADRLLAHVPELEADRILIAKEPLFAAGPRARDAGFLLNALMPWGSLGNEETPAYKAAIAAHRAHVETRYGSTAAEIYGFLAAREGSDRKLGLLDERWIAFKPHPSCGEMKGIPAIVASSDHWDLEHDSPREHFTPSGTWSTYFELPRPRFEALLGSARAHALCGQLNGRLAKALDEVRHLARLLVTTGEREAWAVARRILDDEAVLIERFPAETKGRRALSVELRTALAHLAWGEGGLANPRLHDALGDRALDPTSGLYCTALEDAVFWAAWTRSVFEPLHAEYYRWLGARLYDAPARCGLGRWQSRWGLPPAPFEQIGQRKWYESLFNRLTPAAFTKLYAEKAWYSFSTFERGYGLDDTEAEHP